MDSLIYLDVFKLFLTNIQFSLFMSGIFIIRFIPRCLIFFLAIRNGIGTLRDFNEMENVNI